MLAEGPHLPVCQPDSCGACRRQGQGRAWHARDGAGALCPQGINLAVESLTAALRRVRGEVAAPHAALRGQAAQLRNLHATLDLLRHLLHRLKLVAKLRVRARPRLCPRSG